MKTILVIRPSATTEVTGEGETEEESKAAAMAQVPDGYSVLSIRVER